MSNWAVSWSEKSESIVNQLLEKGVERSCIKSITFSLLEISEIQKKGYEDLSDCLDNILFDGKPAPYGVYSINYFITDIIRGHRIEVVVWAEDDEV